MAHLNIDRGLNAEDMAEFDRFIAAASGVAERYKRRVLTPREIEEHHDVPPRDATVFLRARPVLEVLTVTLAGGPTASLGFDVFPGTGLLRLPRNAGARIAVVFRAGMEPIPEEYRVGVMMIIGHLWRTQRPTVGRRQQFGGRSGDDDVTETIAGWAVPRAALEMLGPPGIS